MSANNSWVVLKDYGNYEPRYEVFNGKECFTVKKLSVYQILY